MKKGLIALVIVIALVGVVLAVGSKKANAPTSDHMPSSAPAANNQSNTPQSGDAVTVQGYAYSPKSLTVKKGTTVTWTNQDVAKHTVTVDDGSPAGGPSGPLFGKGETYKFTFNTVGTYNYHCDPHPYMHGTVTVTE